MILGKGNTQLNLKVQTLLKRQHSEAPYKQCQDFLCPIENRIKEWFPTSIKARLRAKALDPYGFMKACWNEIRYEKEAINIYYKCQNEKCHARMNLRKVLPDSEGNAFALYGCLTHQHSLERNNRSEIVFANETEALDFYTKNLQNMYTISGTKRVEHNYKHFSCRRTKLSKDCGYYPCKSAFSLSPTFAKPQDKFTKTEVEQLGADDTPYSIIGIFYHSHEYDERYHRNQLGIWKKVSNTPRKTPYVEERPRIKNGKIFPLSARLAGITKEDIIAARRKRVGKKHENRKEKAKRKKIN